MTPVPGEARFFRASDRLVLIQNVTLNSGTREVRVDAVLDTGATHCVIPRLEAERLGFAPDNRLGFYRVRGIGGIIMMDRHRLDYVQAGAARAYDVSCLVGESPFDFMLLGMSFIERFTTTLDLDAMRVIFRPRTADRST